MGHHDDLRAVPGPGGPPRSPLLLPLLPHQGGGPPAPRIRGGLAGARLQAPPRPPQPLTLLPPHLLLLLVRFRPRPRRLPLIPPLPPLLLLLAPLLPSTPRGGEGAGDLPWPPPAEPGPGARHQPLQHQDGAPKPKRNGNCKKIEKVED